MLTFLMLFYLHHITEYFFTPRFEIRGPQWTSEIYSYDNSQPASALWYHDHALGKLLYSM